MVCVLAAAFVLIYVNRHKSSNITSDITVRTGEDNIVCYQTEFKEESEKYDFKDLFKGGNSSSDLIYVPPGETVTIDSSRNIPENDITLYDVILDENGNERYTDKEVKSYKLQANGGSVAFELKENTAASLSSDSSSYEKGGIIRGFCFVTKDEDKDNLYRFVIKTDAR